MRIAGKCAGLLLLVIQSVSVPVGGYAGPLVGEDLSFPAAPERFGYAKASKMFKPQGAGLFPALVILPTCGGHAQHHAFDVWAKAAVQRGYAVLVVDPLTPRGVTAPGENCRLPNKVPLERLRKDAFDAAAHLRKQPFVDPDRVALLGLSQGAMAALGVSASLNETPQGRPAFRAIVANYPVCIAVDLTQKITVPLLVQMGDLDTEGPPEDCISQLQKQKDKGAPVELVVYNATHGWDIGKDFTTTNAMGDRVVYRYNPKVTADSVERAFDFLDQRVRASNQKP
jgi:dienelactone hydrolase